MATSHLSVSTHTPLFRLNPSKQIMEVRARSASIPKVATATPDEARMDLLEDRFASATRTAAAMASGAMGGTATVGSASLHLPPPPPLGRVSPGNIRSLILEKEKELHDINEYRIQTLETLLREKETSAQAYKQKFTKLQEDFKYNLKLLEGRDEELALYDTNFASLKNVLRDREAEISELKAHNADVQANLKQEQKRASEQEAYFQQKLKEARAQMEGARWNFDDEVRRVRDEMETMKRKMERQMREQQEDVETQRREITITFDDVMRTREAEFKHTVDELQTRTRELELKIKSTQRESDMAKERCEELKMKVENMQQLLSESEKDAKAMEWQLADLRASKDAKINELEDEILKLQDVKQTLLDEYEGKMAELLQSLHSVEKAFVQQKAQYEDELQRQLRKKDDDAQHLSLRLDGKVQSLLAKLRTLEEQNEQLQAEMKQLTWETEDKLLERDRDVDRLKQEVSDASDQQQTVVADLKQRLWTADRENLSLQEKVKDATLQLQLQREKDKSQRQELSECMERSEELKREIVTINLRWENKHQELEQQLTQRHEQRLRDVQQAKDRLVSEKQATDERLLHAETELHRVRSELVALKSDARIAASFSEQRRSREDAAAPSPLWSEDHGALSLSPLLSDSPQRVLASHASSRGSGVLMESLQAENAKLKELIRQMKDALTQQAQEYSGSSPGGGGSSDAEMARRLQQAEKQCVLLEARLAEAETRVAVGGQSEELTLCQAELIQTKRLLEDKTKRIIELEAQVATFQQQQPSPASLASTGVAATAEMADLKRRLSSSHADIERLVKERSQLMELSNQLTMELRKLKESPSSTSDFSGKKEYENMIAELSRSLEESRVNNKTLKKELRRMVKLQVMQQPQAGEAEADASSARAPVGDHASERRRSSTLSMMKALQDSSRRSSVASSVSSSGSGAPPASLFDEELLSLVRTKLPNGETGSSRSSSVAGSSALRAARRTSMGTVPPSIPEDEEDAEEEEGEAEEEEKEDDNTATTGQPGPTSLSMLFSRDRVDSIASAASSEIAAPVTDARLRLQQAKEMLLLAGKKAERSASLASAAGPVSIRLSDRETPSQKSAIKKLKELQSKRAEMVTERKKVRNYSMAT